MVVFVACVPPVFDYAWTQKISRKLEVLEHPLIQIVKSRLAYLPAAYAMGIHKASMTEIYAVDDVLPSPILKDRIKTPANQDFVASWKITTRQPIIVFMTADDLNQTGIVRDAQDGDLIRIKFYYNKVKGYDINVPETLRL